MAKITISRMLEISRLLGTDAGKQLADFLSYVSDLSEQVIRILRNNVTIGDNIDGKFLQVTLKHDTEQVINTDSRQPAWVAPAKVISTTVSLVIIYG
jgi:hypothetical protein